ncbi:endonuclease/exonuclease/phosphatase family protein [Candidatus Woesebacteria bacterium]|nr:endonuclease/exonuclease/phosphatase family protein [Candidatus Woesebacteria bacterium]
MGEVIRIATLNSEGGAHGPHLLRIQEFLGYSGIQILAMQEVFRTDGAWIKEMIRGTSHHFLNNFTVASPLSERIPATGPFGVALFARFQAIAWQSIYYTISNHRAAVFEDPQEYPTRRGVLIVDYSLPTGSNVRVATTHFTWSPDGQITQEQQNDWGRLSQVLERTQPDVVMGDFNIPRATQLGITLEQTFQSAIPQSVTTTLVPSQHQNPGIPDRVVDYIFIPKDSQYQLVPNSVELEPVADHCAIVCNIVRK